MDRAALEAKVTESAHAAEVLVHAPKVVDRLAMEKKVTDAKVTRSEHAVDVLVKAKDVADRAALEAKVTKPADAKDVLRGAKKFADVERLKRIAGVK